MKRVWLGFRKSNYKDENKIRIRKEQREKLRQLISVGGHEAESQYAELLKHVDTRHWAGGIARKD